MNPERIEHDREVLRDVMRIYRIWPRARQLTIRRHIAGLRIELYKLRRAE